MPGLNFVTFNGPGGTDIGELLAQSTSITRAFRFADGDWQSFFPGQPTFLNQFTTLNRLDAIFIFNASARGTVIVVPEVTN